MAKGSIYSTLFTLIFLFILTCRALPQQYNFQVYSLEQGLAQSQVLYMCIDSRDNLLFGTYGGGVSIYNGVEFHTLTKKDGLASNTVWCIIEDSKKNLWFATSEGVTRYDGYSFERFEGSLVDGTETWRLLEDSEGNIWVGTNGRGAFVYNGHNFTPIDVKDGLAGNSINAMIEDYEGNIWIGDYRKGITIINKSGHKRYLNTDNGLTSNVINNLWQDEQGKVWICTDKGVNIYYNKTFQYLSTSDGLPSDVVTDIFKDSNGDYWFSTYGGGICRYDGDIIISFDEDQGMPSNNVYQILEDETGCLWIGTDGGGACKFLGTAFKHYTKKEGLSSNIVMAVLEDSKGNLWLGSDGEGVNRLSLNEEGGVGKIKRFAGDELKSTTVNAILEDDLGNIWFGTYAEGVTVFNGKTFKNYNIKDGLHSSFVNALFLDSKGNVWAAGEGGLTKFDGNTFTAYTEEDGLISANVWSLTEDSSGNIWAGTDNGVARFNGKQFTHFGKIDGLVSGHVIAAATDAKGNPWFGTDKGLSVYIEEIQEFRNYTMEDGLTSENFYLIGFDNLGNVMAGSEKGLDKIEMTDDYRIKKIKNYNSRNGFSGIECNANAVCKNKEGIMWFGTVKGVTRYNPSKEYTNFSPPETRITGLKLFFEDAGWGDYADTVSKWDLLPVNLSLPYDKNHLTFSFIGVNMRSSGDISYRFFLDGFEENWSPVTKKNEITYSNLPPGEYVFNVIAANDEGIWNEEPVRYSFRINKPFWQTWWFGGMALSGLLLLFWGIMKLRTRQLYQSKKLLEEQVKLRTLEIQQKNEKLTDSIRYAKFIQEAILPEMDTLSDHFPESFIIHLPRDIVSGDFYWFTQVNQISVIAAADCTGHGVPGAFMSLIGNEFLHQIVKEKSITGPDKALKELDEKIKRSLNQKGKEAETKDGMDIALCAIHRDTNLLQFAGAHRPALIFRNGEMIKLKPGKHSIGGYDKQEKIFNEHRIQLIKGDTLYLFSDGVTDQFGGPSSDGKKFLMKRFRELLASIQELDMEKQKEAVLKAFYEWKGDQEQVDDVCIIGVRV